MKYIAKINSYKTFYKKYHQDIEIACQCVESNPCKKLNTSIEELKQSVLNPLYNLDWNDDVKNAFDDNLKICADDLDDIITSISTEFTQSENEYKSIKENLSNLLYKTNILDGKVKHQPDRSSYEKIDTLGNKTYPGYDDDYQEWKDGCDTLETQCDEIVSAINDSLLTLEEINGKSISISNIQVGSLFNLNTKYNDIAYLDDSNAINEWLETNANYITVNGNTIRFTQGEGSPWTSGKIHGINLRTSGCGILSLATSLTYTLSDASGGQVLVTPEHVLNGLYTYCSEHDIPLSRFISSGFQGVNNGIDKAISEIWNVDCIAYDGHLESSQIKQLIDGNSSVVFSYQNKGHLAAITDTTDTGRYIVADTGTGLATYVAGVDDFKASSKYALCISKNMYKESDGQLLDANGSPVDFDKACSHTFLS